MTATRRVREERVEMVRLALPARVYTRNRLDYAAQVVARGARRAKAIRGVRTISGSPLLGGFLACYVQEPEAQNA